MSIREKQELKKQRQAFTNENNPFIIRYELIAKKQMSKTKIMKELGIKSAEYEALKTKYLQLFYGQQ